MKTAKILFNFKYISNFFNKNEIRVFQKYVFGNLELSSPTFN